MEEMIENYLLGLLSEAETKAFENRIATDENLAREVAVQRDIMQAAKLQGLKAEISNAYRNVRMGKMLKTAFISVVVAAVLGVGIYYLAKAFTPKIDATEIGASLPSHLFEIDNTRDTVIETPNGIIFHIPANAFGGIEDAATHSIFPDGTIPDTKKIVETTHEQKHVTDSSIAFTNEASSLREDVNKEVLVKLKQTTFPTQTNLFAHLQTEYPSFYATLNEDFDLTDPTFHASFQVIYCNFKKTPILLASDATKTKKYDVPLRRNFGKELEIRKIFQASAKDENPCVGCGDVSSLN